MSQRKLDSVAALRSSAPRPALALSDTSPAVVCTQARRARPQLTRCGAHAFVREQYAVEGLSAGFFVVLGCVGVMLLTVSLPACPKLAHARSVWP